MSKTNIPIFLVHQEDLPSFVYSTDMMTLPLLVIAETII